MKYRTLFFLLAGFVFSQPYPGLAQTGSGDTKLSSAIYTHYSADELSQIQAADSAKYNAIVYYYTQSFIVEPIGCNDCVPTDLSVFDVSKYEMFRKQDARYVRRYDKYGFKLTLLSIDELAHKLPVHYAKNQ